jgi:hypothetical protein
MTEARVPVSIINPKHLGDEAGGLQGPGQLELGHPYQKSNKQTKNPQ